MFCFTFVVKEWAKSRKKSHISSKLYGLLFAIFSATWLEFLSWNLRNRRILLKDRWTEVIEFRENFAWFRANTCDIVCKENLKHSILLSWVIFIAVVSLEKRRSGNEWLSAMLIPSISYKQTRLAPVSYKDSGLKVLFTFQVFLCFRIFVLIVWMCPMPYRTIKHFQKAEPKHYFDYTNWRLKICIWQLKFSSYSPQGDLTIFLISSPEYWNT